MNKYSCATSKKIKDKKERKSPVTAVLFIEQTRTGELARRLWAAEAELARITGFRLKTVDRSGATVPTTSQGSPLGWRSLCLPFESGAENYKSSWRSALYMSESKSFISWCLPNIFNLGGVDMII